MNGHSWSGLLWLLMALLIAADNETAISPLSEEASTFYELTTSPSISESSSITTNTSSFLAVSQSTPTLSFMNLTDTVSTTDATTPLGLHLYFPPRLAPVHHHHQGTRWGPYFEEGVEPQNITARVGSTVRLDCKIGMLHDKTMRVILEEIPTVHNEYEQEGMRVRHSGKVLKDIF